MAHTPVDPGTPAALTTPLQVLSGGTVLFEAPLVRPGTGRFERNQRGYQAFESDEQVAAGDGRRVVGERTLDLIVTGQDHQAAHAALHDLDAALQSATHLRWNDMLIELAGAKGIISSQPVLTGGPNLRVTIAYLPRRAAGTLPDTTPVLGPL